MSRCAEQIVITGAAAITAAGNGLPALLEAVAAERCCLSAVPDELSPVRQRLLWGKAEQFKAADFMPPLKARKLDRGSQFTVATAGMALADAALARNEFPAERIGIALGCGFGGIANSAEFLGGYFKEGAGALSPLLFPNTVANAPASNASIEHGIKGPNITFVQRFCSAESAIMAACRFIEEGRADLMLAGGVDELYPLVLHGFNALGQLRSYADGFGEGCGLVVLERAGHARARGARIMAQIEAVSSVGLLLPERRSEGVTRLLGQRRSYARLVLSGAEQCAAPLLEQIDAATCLTPGRLVGRSLAMGGTALALLAAQIKPAEQGLVLASSPEGPHYALAVRGGCPD